MKYSTHLGHSVKATKNDLVNMSIEEKRSPLSKYMLKETVYTLPYLLRKL